MASQQAKWREDQILIICPGSQTTMAQLGCHELTPPAYRIPTRMFRDPSGPGWRPYHTYRRKKNATNGTASAAAATATATATATVTATTETAADAGGGGGGGDAPDAKPASAQDAEYEDVEDPDSVEGAVYPLQGGQIIHMDAFLAFLDHVHSLLTKTYHNTPILLMASPQWTRGQWENVASYIFEKTKTPALCLLHSGIATHHGMKFPSMTIVDIGFEKVDVTCIHDFQMINQRTLGYPSPVRDISGGEVFTQKLLTLLKHKGFTRDMAEQLKKSSLCEVLPYDPNSPDLMELPTATDAEIADAAALAALADGDDGNPEAKDGEEGVLDVANIVTSGNTREFLAKKEKEKAEKAKSKKGKGQEADSSAGKPAKLPNSKRKNVIFHYEELVHEDVEVPVSTNGAAKEEQPKTDNANPEAVPTAEGAAPGEAAAPSEPAASSEAAPPSDAAVPVPSVEAEKPAAATKTVTERRTKRVTKDVEVGLERFLFADRIEIDRIVSTIYMAIQSGTETYQRPALWDNLVFVGNGSRLRGLRENIVQTLHARHLISPSTATIFTSELPSNIATPTGTGSQTPTGSYTGPVPSTTNVNPLLQAATAQAQAQSQNQGQGQGTPGPAAAAAVAANADAAAAAAGSGGHHAHGQTPTSIKLLTPPTYLAEWNKIGFEEAMFLGSLVYARLVFCLNVVDADTLRFCMLTRVDYNILGPRGIRDHCSMG